MAAAAAPEAAPAVAPSPASVRPRGRPAEEQREDACRFLQPLHRPDSHDAEKLVGKGIGAQGEQQLEDGGRGDGGQCRA